LERHACGAQRTEPPPAGPSEAMGRSRARWIFLRQEYLWRARGVGVVLRGLGADVFRYQERRVILCSYQVMQELFSHVVCDLGFTYHKRFGCGGGVR